MARKSKNAYRKSSESADGEVRLLSGGNPQIAKADGDAPVQKYIAHTCRSGRAAWVGSWTI